MYVCYVYAYTYACMQMKECMCNCVCEGRYCHLKFFEVVSRNQDRQNVSVALYYTRYYRQLKLPILIPIPILVFTHFPVYVQVHHYFLALL